MRIILGKTIFRKGGKTDERRYLRPSVFYNKTGVGTKPDVV